MSTYFSQYSVKPISNFKAGDKIIMLQNCSGLKRGQMYTLEEYQGRLLAGGRCGHEEYWQKVEDNDIRFNDMKIKTRQLRNKHLKKNKDFQIGDTVEVIKKGRSYGSKVHYGDFAKVIKVGLDYVVTDFPNCEGLWNDEVEIVIKGEENV